MLVTRIRKAAALDIARMERKRVVRLDGHVYMTDGVVPVVPVVPIVPAVSGHGTWDMRWRCTWRKWIYVSIDLRRHAMVVEHC